MTQSSILSLFPEAGSWWALSTGGALARLHERAVVDGALTAAAASELLQRGFFGSRSRAVSITVVPTTTCNLTCSYCTQNVPSDSRLTGFPTRIAVKTMTDQTIDALCKFARDQLQRQQRDMIDLVLFGGEPLLRVDICLDLLQRFKELATTHGSLVTNGTRLSGIVSAALRQAGLERVQITLDGAKTEHDQERRTRRGVPSYDLVVENAAAAVDADLRVSLRVNLSLRNFRRIPDLLADLASRLDAPRVAIDFALIEDVGVGFNRVLAPGVRTVDILVRSAEIALDYGFVVHPKTIGRCAFCSGEPGAAGAVVSADGAMYSCWDAVGISELVVGSVQAGYIPEPQLSARWHSCGFRSLGGRANEAAADLREYNQALARLIARRVQTSAPSVYVTTLR